MPGTFSIDLIICTYNNAELLRRTLDSCTKLKLSVLVKWKVIVVNNNSTDQTAYVVQEFIEHSNLPLQTVWEPRQGLTAARVCGVKNSFAEWAAFIDDDCLLAEDWLEQAALFITTHPTCGIFGSRINLVFEKEPPSYVYRFPFAYAGKNHGNISKRLEAVAGAGMVAKMEALRKCGWVKDQYLNDRIGKRLVSGGDMEIVLRTGVHYEIWYNAACRLDHIITKERTSKKYLERMLFGLGASRHNVSALKWQASYILWLLYSLVYFLGFILVGFIEMIKGWVKRTGIGWRISFSPALGWLSAIWAMLLMQKSKRETILGCVKTRS